MGELTRNLLADTGEIVTTVAIVAACVLAALLLLYGFIKRFSRTSWAGVQIIVIFAATLALSKLPESWMSTDMARFAVTAGGILVCIAVVLIVGAIVRTFFRTRKKRAHWFFRTFDRLFGAINTVLNFGVFLLVLGGLVLNVIYWCAPSVAEGQLSLVYTYSLGDAVVWEAAKPYLPDFILVAVLTMTVKGGYRLGLVKAVWVVCMMALTLVAFGGSILAAVKVPFLANFGAAITSSFAAKIPYELLCNVLGYGIVALCVFIVAMIVIVLLNLLIGLGVREMDSVGVIRVIDGSIFAIFMFAVMGAFICGLDFAVSAAADGTFGEQLAQIAAQYRLSDLFGSGSLCSVFYECNPIRALAG